MTKRQKTKAFSFQGFDNAHYEATAAYTRAVNSLFDKATSDIADFANKEDYNPNKSFSFDDYPKAKARLQTTLKGLAKKMQAVIELGSRKQWLFACQKNDEFIASIFDTTKLTKGRMKKMQDRNLDALQSFQQRKVGGMNLSERVWKYTEQYKEQIEIGLDVGLGEGRSAQQLARDLRQNLQDPNRLFRRVRDKRGNLHLSKAAKAFHPGTGVYRSSYKNAMRLTRSEVNMAYRESDHLRWQQLDFVVGFEVQRSNHEPKCKCKLCERLVGKYPKWFKFKGWHPQCLCYATAILMDEEDFDNQELSDLKSALKGTAYKKLSAKNEVTDLPDGFKEWVNENKEKQGNWSSTPYFIKDNFVDGDLTKGLMYVPGIKPAVTPTFDYDTPNEVLDAYISGDAMWVNNYLRGRVDFGTLSDEEQLLLDELTAITQKEKVGERILWRSVDARAVFGDMSDSEYEDFLGRLVYGDERKAIIEKTQRFFDVGGTTVQEKGFMSTTKDKKIALEWGGYTGSRTPVLMKIKTTAETQGIDVERYTLIHNPQAEYDQPQKEVLLRRGLQYKVISIKALDGHICVEVELLDNANENSNQASPIDPIQQELDAMQGVIADARNMCAEWGISSSVIDDALQARSPNAVRSAILTLNNKVSSLMNSLSAYLKEAMAVKVEADSVGVDFTPVIADIQAVQGNKAQWTNNQSGFKARLDNIRSKIELAKKKTDELDSVIETLEKTKIVYNEVKTLGKKLSESDIVSRVGGGDLTNGSCSSLAFAYAGNKGGLDVLDFRDGESRKQFSTRSVIMKVAEKVGGVVVEEFSDFKATKELLKHIKEDKEYYFACAAHAAIIRKTANGYEYLELQSATSNGFQPLSDEVLKWRFGAKRSRSHYRQKYKSTSCLIDIDRLNGSVGFKKMLGYINTNEKDQKKGAMGTMK